MSKVPGMNDQKPPAVPLWPLLLVFFLGGLALGFSFRETRVRVQEKVVIQERVKELDQERLKAIEASLEKLSRTITTTQDVHREITKVKRPDGTRETKVIEGSSTKQVVTEVKEVEKQVVVTQEVVRVVDRDVVVQREVKVEPVLPNWRAGPLVGLDLPGTLQGLQLQPVFGASVERRLGPVWVGVWGLSSGVAGLKLNLEF